MAVAKAPDALARFRPRRSPRIEPPRKDARRGPRRRRAAPSDRRDRRRDRARGDRVRVLPTGLGQRPHQRQGRGGGLVPAGRRARLPARLRRHGRPVHRPPGRLHRLRAEEAELAAMADLDTFQRLPWDAWACTATATTPRPGSCSTRTRCRGPEADRERHRAGARLQLPVRDRAGDDVAEAVRGRRRGPRGRDEAVVLPHQPVRAAAPGDPRRDHVRQGDGARHELRRPRGRARPARAELPLRPRAPHGGQHHDPTPDTAVGREHGFASFMPKPFTACRRTDTTTTFRSSTRAAPTCSTTRRARPSSRRSGSSSWAGSSTTSRRSVHRLADRELVQADVGLRASGRRCT